MNVDTEPKQEKADSKSDAISKKEAKSPPRDIPGNFPYTTSHGVFRQVLQAMIDAERPAKFSGDFLNTVLGFTGGSAAVVPPILKRTGFLSADATPTELYSRFKSEGGRSQAALDALRNGFGEIFKKNEYAHKLPEDGVKDLLVAITGLNKNDPVIRAISGTFGTIKSFIDPSKLSETSKTTSSGSDTDKDFSSESGSGSEGLNVNSKLGLSYSINIVIPNTDDPNVLNAIFKSLKENLLK